MNPGINYIPDEAIQTSQRAKSPIGINENGQLRPGNSTGDPDDPYSEEKVSVLQPEIATVKNSPPDDKVLPG